MDIEKFINSVCEDFDDCDFGDNVSFGLLIVVKEKDGTWVNFNCGPKITPSQFFYFMNLIYKDTKNGKTSRSATDTSAQ